MQHRLTHFKKGLRVIKKIICHVQLLNGFICNCFAEGLTVQLHVERHALDREFLQ